MPVYNEENTIMQAVGEILGTSYPCEVEFIVVDDGSTDNTAILLSHVHDNRLIVHRHPANKGKGAALRSAMALATGTHLLPFDADLEYAAEDIPRMLEPVLKGRCDVVYGTRLFGCNTVYQSYRYAVGNQLLTFLANVFFNANLSDLHTCLKLIPSALLRELHLNEIGFGLDTEVTALLLRRGVRPFEVPVSYYSRSHAQGKKINWHDAIKSAYILLRIRLWSRSHKNVTIQTHQRQLPSAVRISVPTSRAEVAGSMSLLKRLGAEVAEVGPQWSQPYLPETVCGDDSHIA